MTTSIWEQIESDPAKAAVLQVRNSLLLALEAEIRRWKITVNKAAKRLRIAEPQVCELLDGQFSKFDLDTLVEMAQRIGLEPRIETNVSIRKSR